METASAGQAGAFRNLRTGHETKVSIPNDTDGLGPLKQKTNPRAASYFFCWGGVEHFLLIIPNIPFQRASIEAQGLKDFNHLLGILAFILEQDSIFYFNRNRPF